MRQWLCLASGAPKMALEHTLKVKGHTRGKNVLSWVCIVDTSGLRIPFGTRDVTVKILSVSDERKS
jgi:hypothetical protein